VLGVLSDSSFPFLTNKCVSNTTIFFIAVSACSEKARALFGPVKAKYQILATKIPANQFYRYHDMWRFANQRLAFLIALTVYLETGELASREVVADTLGGKLASCSCNCILYTA
jgi:hypothetical protein